MLWRMGPSISARRLRVLATSMCLQTGPKMLPLAVPAHAACPKTCPQGREQVLESAWASDALLCRPQTADL
jgi:hypothetical protein